LSRWSSSDPADVAWRREQMSANNDIEGVRRDPQADQLMARLDAEGKSPAEKRDALRDYFVQKPSKEPSGSVAFRGVSARIATSR